MSPIRVSGDTRISLNDAALKRRLRDLEKKSGDLKTMFRFFDRDVGDFFRRRFETAGRYGGRPWKPLSASTRKARRRAGETGNQGGVGKPLWATGQLKRSLEEVGGQSIRSIGRKSYVRGTRVPYAVHHQEGRGVPEREIVPETNKGLPSVLVVKLMKRLREHIGL